MHMSIYAKTFKQAYFGTPGALWVALFRLRLLAIKRCFSEARQKSVGVQRETHRFQPPPLKLDSASILFLSV